MTTIVRPTLENALGDGDRWARIAALTSAWATERGVSLRDAVMLVPFAQLLPEARRAFSRAGGWMPRIETTRTLATSLGPPSSARAGQLSFDATLDALTAAALLRSQAWGAAWAKRDGRGFEQATGSLVATAHELARAASSLLPTAREAFWNAAREQLGPMSGPGTSERLLGRVALEWASLAPAPITDRLFDMQPPAAWIAVKAGGADPLTNRVMNESDVPCLVIDADALDDDLFANLGSLAPTLAVCSSFEDEAQCAAAQVLVHLERGEVPIALIAQDRVLVRRVRALLECHDLRLLDETGWKLSTTRAAALVMSLLRAARPEAGTDALFDWLKAGTDDEVALGALEATCRREHIARIADLTRAELDPLAQRLWSAASSVLARLNEARRQPLLVWLAALSGALEASGAMAALQQDDAGAQVLATLRLTSNSAAATDAWTAGATQLTMSLTEFRNWVDSALEQATFRPTAAFDDAPDVIVTPLAGAMLRPFAAVVLPGADNKHLGASTPSASLLGDAQAATLGMPTAADRRGSELFAFVAVLGAPRLTLLRRSVDGGDPLADSPLVERLSMALAARGRSLLAWHDPRANVELASTPIHMTAPAAPGMLPARLSASACEALRACPYRFFALNMLRLREDDELDREVEKRDYGTWLHDVLHDFHETRDAPRDAAFEIARMFELARGSQQKLGLADADFMPFAASFESFAPRYVVWLHARDADGASWLSGETEVVMSLDEFGGTELRGIIDRVDQRKGGAAIELIDYKTGSAAGLKEKVSEPLEDTQLAFYAALMRSRTNLPLTASYLALDGSKGIEEVEHKGVEASAAALVEGLADDLRRLRAGAGLPALGVGATCEYCAARGICRRDHWDEVGA